MLVCLFLPKQTFLFDFEFMPSRFSNILVQNYLKARHLVTLTLIRKYCFFFQNRIGESEGSESLPVRVNFIACSTCINRHFFSRAAFTSLERYYGISTGELSRFLTGKLLQCLLDNLDFYNIGGHIYNIGHIEKREWSIATHVNFVTDCC